MSDEQLINDDDDGDVSHLLPDTVPEWLAEMVKNSKGRDLEKYGILNQFFQETQVVRANRFDTMHYNDMREKAKELDEAAVKRWTDDPTWFELIQDVYLALYKPRPEVNKDGEMKPTHRLNHAAFTRANQTREWPELRAWTELDKWASAMATTEFAIKLGDLFDELKELQEERKKLRDEQQKLDDMLSGAGKDGSGIEDAEAFLDDLEQQMEAYEEQVDATNAQMAADMDQVRGAARQAVGDALEDAETSLEMLSAFGTEAGDLKRIPHEARIELAQRLHRNAKLRELADKVGRFVRFAMGEQARKIIHGVDEVHDVELGNNVNRLLPSELMLLADEDTEMLFFAKFAEKNLLQYQLRGVENVGRGAIIAMVDTSGSMYGARETWAKAVAVALLNIAKKQNRAFYGILFGSKHDPLVEFQFDPKQQAKQIVKQHNATPTERTYTHEIEAVLDFAEYEYGGGTDFEYPISRGIEILDDQYNDEGRQKGDLVMITDGECVVSPEWFDRYENSKRELAFRHYGCLIGIRSTTLESLCDEVYDIQELGKAEDASSMFGYV